MFCLILIMNLLMSNDMPVVFIEIDDLKKISGYDPNFVCMQNGEKFSGEQIFHDPEKIYALHIYFEDGIEFLRSYIKYECFTFPVFNVLIEKGKIITIKIKNKEKKQNFVFVNYDENGEIKDLENICSHTSLSSLEVCEIEEEMKDFGICLFDFPSKQDVLKNRINIEDIKTIEQIPPYDSNNVFFQNGKVIEDDVFTISEDAFSFKLKLKNGKEVWRMYIKNDKEERLLFKITFKQKNLWYAYYNQYEPDKQTVAVFLANNDQNNEGLVVSRKSGFNGTDEELKGIIDQEILNFGKTMDLSLFKKINIEDIKTIEQIPPYDSNNVFFQNGKMTKELFRTSSSKYVKIEFDENGRELRRIIFYYDQNLSLVFKRGKYDYMAEVERLKQKNV